MSSLLSRRKFCKLSALASIGLLLFPHRASSAKNYITKNEMRGKCRIDIVRCNCFSDLQGRYLDDPEAGPCTKFKVGQSIIITPDNIQSIERSDIVCANAWRILKPYVIAALAAGETTECAPASKTTQAVVSCPDGTRPVIFKVTAC